MNKLQKQSGGPISNIITALPTNFAVGLVNPLHTPMASVSNLYGLLSGPPDEEEKERRSKDSLAWNLIPYRSGYDQGRRVRGAYSDSLAAGARHPLAHLIADYGASMPTSILTPTILGALMGAGVGGVAGGDVRRSAGMGALGGLGLAGAGLVGGGLGALFTKRRNISDQVEADSSKLRLLAKYLIPGVSVYDNFKRVGSTGNWGKEDKSDKKKDNDTDKDTQEKKSYVVNAIRKELAKEKIRRYINR